MAQNANNKVLFLTSDLPYPARGGGKIRDQHVLKLLLERLEVELLCFGDEELARAVGGTDIPPALAVSMINRKKAPLWRRLIYPFRPYVVNGYSDAMERALRARAETGKLLWVSRLAMAQYVTLAKSLGYRVVLDEHNVETNLMRGETTHMPSLKNLSGMIKSAQCNYYESLFCEAAHAVVATSDIDASRLAKMAPDATVHVIPNSVDCEDFAPVRAATGGTTLFFSGTLSYAPNVDGLNWFVAEVLPRLRGHFGKDLPPIVVAGADPSPELAQRLAFAGIELHANPPSMLPLLAGAAVVFVPLHSGSGTRLKILEAMAAGRAVVSTGKGAEGLTLSPGFDILIADDPDRFTSAIVKLFENTKLRTELGGRASQTIENRYDWRRGRPMLEHLLTRLSSVETSKESKWRQKSSH